MPPGWPYPTLVRNLSIVQPTPTLEHGISALVEMANELDAKKAFETLAYSKKFLGGKPLYLEWAPMDVFDENHPARQPAK